MLFEHWQHNEEGPSTPVLARTMSWPTDKQYDPTIDETKQRWGTPDWSSADEEEEEEDEDEYDSEDDSEDESLATDDDDDDDDYDLQAVAPSISLVITYPFLRASLWLLSARWLDYEKPQVPNNWRVLATDVKTLLRWLHYILIIQQLKYLHSITWLNNQWASLPPKLKYLDIQCHDSFTALRQHERYYFYEYWTDDACDWLMPWWPTTFLNWIRQRYQFWWSVLGWAIPDFFEQVVPIIVSMIMDRKIRRLREETPGGTEWVD
jgi:hypothetical protein